MEDQCEGLKLGYATEMLLLLRMRIGSVDDGK